MDQNGTDSEGIKVKPSGSVVRAVILTGWIMTLLIVATVIGTTMALVWMGRLVPDYLSQWMGIALGYVFATFPAMLKDYMDG